MPTLGNIQKQIAMYLKKSLVDFDVTGDAGQNLVLTALNNARKHAEKVHDFSICRQRGYFSFASKAAWDSPTWYDGATEKLRKGKLWDLRTVGDIAQEFSGTNIPLRMVRGDTKHQLESRRAYDAAVSDFERRALPDSTLLFDHPFLNQVYLMTRGKWLEYYPYSTDTKNIMVDGYRWWPDWTNDVTGLPQVIVDFDGAGLNLAGFADGGTMTMVSNNYVGSAYPNWEFDDNSTVTPGWTAISLPVTVESIKFAINTYGGDVSTMPTATVNSAGKLVITGPKAGVASNLQVTISMYGNIDFKADASGAAAGANSSTEDWWTENASEYLLWRALVECNHLGHVFTANREANLPSPDKKADLALALLIQNDQDAENPGEIQQY